MAPSFRGGNPKIHGDLISPRPGSAARIARIWQDAAVTSPAPKHSKTPTPTDRDVPAVVRYIGKPDEPAALDLVRRNKRERTVRAVQVWAMCWGGAIVAVFMPVLHFILVPSLLLAGPLVASMRWNERATVITARGRCPGCGAEFAADLNTAAKPELPWRCSACGRPLTFALDPAVLAGPEGVAA